MKVLKLSIITEDVGKNLMQFNGGIIQWQMEFGVGKGKIIHKERVSFNNETICNYRLWDDCYYSWAGLRGYTGTSNKISP